jgi:phage gp29-like protein
MANDLVPFQAEQPAPLVDSRGRPMREAYDRLTREVAAPMMAGFRSIMSDHPAQGLTPARLAQILRAAEQGNAQAYLELAEEIEEKYPHYQSVMGTRKRAVSQLPITVVAAGDSPEEEGDAQLIRDWLTRLTLQGELFDILDAIGKGYSVTEIIWSLSASEWTIDKLKWRLPQFFEFDQVTGEELLLKGGEDGTSGVPQPLSPYKYIVHTASAKSGLPIRGGLARTVAWYYLFINFTIKDWMTFLEVYGLPLRVGKYANGTSEEDIRKLAQAVAQIGSDAGCVIPQSMVIEFIQSGGAAANPEIFRAFCMYADDQVSKAVLGQTSSADAKAGGLGSGQANLHGDVRDDIRDADAMAGSVTLTRDVGIPLVMFNRGVRRRYPMILIGKTDSIDMTTGLTAIDAAVKYKVPVGMGYFRKVTGVPEPEPGEEQLSAPAATMPPNGAGDGSGPPGAGKPPRALLGASYGQSGAVRRPGQDAVAAAAEIDPGQADAIDQMIAEGIGQLGGLDDQLLGKFEELIASATSMEEVRELLALRAGDIIDSMDVAAIVQLGERMGFATKIAGLVAKPGE